MKPTVVTGYKPTTQGKLPIDELCQCGKRKSEHSPQIARRGSMVVVLPGHGDGVNCPEFRFKDFIFDDTDTRPIAQGWKP